MAHELTLDPADSLQAGLPHADSLQAATLQAETPQAVIPRAVPDTTPAWPRRPRPPLRIAADAAPVDLGAAEQAAADFLTALGVTLDREELQETPARMARAYAELLAPRPFDLTTFPNDEGYDELVLARSIPFRTVCEHHLLPFSGVAHVGYLPADRIVGLSKLARLTEHFAARPQVQERLTRQIADSLAAHLHPRGAGVVLEAEHSCMTDRGVRALGSTTVTSAMTGTLRTDPRSRAEFFALAGISG